MESDSIFIIYFKLKVFRWEKYKTLIKSNEKNRAKETLLIKINKEFPIYELKNIRIYELYKSNYKGKRFSDKEWDILLKLSYPNHKGKLFKFKVNDEFGIKNYSKRNKNGTFKKGFSPWNKNLKLQMTKKDESGKFDTPRSSDGKFKKGVKPNVIGSKI